MRIILPYMLRWNSLNRSRYVMFCRELTQLGWTVTVLQPPSANASGETGFSEAPGHENPRVEVREVSVPQFPLLPKALGKLLYAWRCRAVLKRLDADILWLYHPFHLLLLPGWGRRLVVYDIADDYAAMTRHELGWWGPLGAAVVGWLVRRLVQRADLVTVVSQPLNDAYGQGRALLLPNGGVTGSRSRRPGHVIGFAGSLEYFVDLDLLAAVADRLPDFCFEVWGGGRRAAAAKRTLVRPNVAFRGPFLPEQLSAILQRFDVAVIPFDRSPVSTRSAPLKLFDYLGHGLPVVTTPLGVRLESPCVATAVSAEQFAAAIRRFAEQPPDAKACRHAITGHTWPVLAAALDAQLRELLPS